jgi:hypothetical protein
MKKLILFIFAGICILSFLSCNSKDKEAWENAKKLDTYASYDAYVQQYPEGQYITEATAEKEEALWMETLKNNTIDDYNIYMDNYKTGKYYDDAKAKRDELQAKEDKEKPETGSDKGTGSPADAKSITKVKALLTKYCKNLFSESFDASDYFANDVEQFIAMTNTTADKITTYIKDSYHKEFQNGVYIIEESPFTVTKYDDGTFEAVFIEKGKSLRKSLNKTQNVRIKIKAVLNSDYKIINWQEIQILENKLD